MGFAVLVLLEKYTMEGKSSKIAACIAHTKRKLNLISFHEYKEENERKEKQTCRRRRKKSKL